MKRKRCSRCGKKKNVDQFGSHAARPDGLQSWCKKCQKTYQSCRRKRLGERRQVTAPKKKRCSRCHRKRGREHFHSSKHQLDGLHNQCRDCVRDRQRENGRRHPLVTDGEMEGMLKRQEGRCGICEADVTEDRCVDHCHRSGLVRGLLCGCCNTGLGFFKDDPKRLEAAIEYLGGKYALR